MYWHICLRGLSHCGWCLAGKCTGISVYVDCRTVVGVYGEAYAACCSINVVLAVRCAVLVVVLDDCSLV